MCINNHQSSLLITLLFFIGLTPCAAQWQPDAGVVPSYTDQATVITSSGIEPEKLIDGNIHTFWQSDAVYPNNFLKREDLNAVLNYGVLGQISSSSPIDYSVVTDGKQETSAYVTPHAGSSFVRLNLFQPTYLASIACILNTTAPVSIEVIFDNGSSESIGSYVPGDNYAAQRFQANKNEIAAIRLSSAEAFAVHEIGALKGAATEYAIFDLKSSKKIGWIETRHWAGGESSPNASSTHVYISDDGADWQEVNELEPMALFPVVSRVDPPVMARYIKLEHEIADKDWEKVFLWELDAYDENGPFGPMPSAETQQKKVIDILGINGIWGWGNNNYSTYLAESEGPRKYNKVATHARNYHLMDWDVKDPDDSPGFTQMATGGGTSAHDWLNWDTEYENWQEAGFSNQATIKFNARMFEQHTWNDPYQAAFNYGLEFASHFGSSGNKLIDIVEVGNEPWDYDPDFYREILRGMSLGLKQGDPQMTVLPCALQSAFPAMEQTEYLRNYMGVRLTEQESVNIDGLNLHHYSYANNALGERIAVHPEHPESSMRAILNDIRFRDQNLPSLPLYVSEWGWDSDGVGEDCTHSECVSEQAQAIYAIRGALWYMRLGVERLTWFFYANDFAGSSLYTRSGLTGSVNTGFAKKKSFVAFEALIHHLGEQKFLSVLKEEDAWVYLFGPSETEPTHMVYWNPVSADDISESQVEFNLAYAPVRSWKISGNHPQGEATNNPTYQNGKYNVRAGAVPVIVELGERITAVGGLSAVAFLQGPFDSKTGKMKSGLTANGLVPLNQPFNNSPWWYSGQESITNSISSQSVVDWLLLEARSSSDPNQVEYKKAVLLLDDGKLVDASDFEENIELDGLAADNYYFSIRSRNHLAIVTSSAVSYPSESVIDFSDVAQVMGGNEQVIHLGGNRYGMRAGDFDANGVINTSDFNAFKTQKALIKKYVKGDFNLDKVVSVSDLNLLKPNSSSIGVTPIRY